MIIAINLFPRDAIICYLYIENIYKWEVEIIDSLINNVDDTLKCFPLTSLLHTVVSPGSINVFNLLCTGGFWFTCHLYLTNIHNILPRLPYYPYSSLSFCQFHCRYLNCQHFTVNYHKSEKLLAILTHILF